MENRDGGGSLPCGPEGSGEAWAVALRPPCSLGVQGRAAPLTGPREHRFGSSRAREAHASVRTRNGMGMAGIEPATWAL